VRKIFFPSYANGPRIGIVIVSLCPRRLYTIAVTLWGPQRAEQRGRAVMYWRIVGEAALTRRKYDLRRRRRAAAAAAGTQK